MILLCRAYCSCEFSGPEFMLVELTDELVNSMKARQQLAVGLETYGAESFHFDSIRFRDWSPVWFRRFEARAELLDSIEEEARVLIRPMSFDIPGTEHGADLIARTEMDGVQVWPEYFVFTCCLRHTGITVCSEIIHFDRFFDEYACIAGRRTEPMAAQADRNIRRRKRARAVLDSYKHTVLCEDGPVIVTEDTADLFADLCHLLTSEGGDPEDIFRIAFGHYEHETDPANTDEEDSDNG